MKDKEFLEFLTNTQAPPAHLKEMARKDIVLSFNGRSLLMKFVGFQILGALISLSFCPQFGMSFFVEGHGITHQLRMIGDWACAVFCGSLFLSTGTILALFFMKADELFWIFNRQKISLLLIPAFLWAILMLLNLTLDLPTEDKSYHFTWIAAAMAVPFMWLKLQRLFSKQSL